MIKIYSRVLGFANKKHSRQNPRSVPKRKEKKVKSSYIVVKSAFLRIISPALLGPGLVQDGSLSGVSLGMDVRGSGYGSPSGGDQRVIWRSVVYPGIDSRAATVYVPRLLKTRTELFPCGSTYLTSNLLAWLQ